MLASIDLDDDAGRVTSKIDDVAVNTNLPTEMRSQCWNSMAQVPPELPLGLRRSRAHRAGEATLRRHDRAIALRPDSRLVACGHVIASLRRPPTPNPSPSRLRACPLPADLELTKPRQAGVWFGEGSRPSLPLAHCPTRKHHPRAAANVARRGVARSACMSLRTELRFSRSPTASMIAAMAEGASTPSA